MLTDTKRLIDLDHEHVWHPFTPMAQWRQGDPLIIEYGEGPYLFDTEGKRYIDGVSSLWCNVHGHNIVQLNQAIQEQLDRVAHTTLLGLASPPSIELAARLCQLVPGALSKVFYSDAGATAVEVALKMAVAYWFHVGQPQKNQFIGFRGGYHGDTTGAMSVGFCEQFHQPFGSMVFPVTQVSAPDACRPPQGMRIVADVGSSVDRCWPSEDQQLAVDLSIACIAELKQVLDTQAHSTAAIIIEPVMQGAAGMICQPRGFVQEVARLARKYDVLLIADEVATGFGRTGKMFACEHETDDSFAGPDIMCLGKGLTGGYLPLAATVATDQIEQAFRGTIEEGKTLFHGHTYTGNALGCAVAMASLELFDQTNLLGHIDLCGQLMRDRLEELAECPGVRDIRQRGLMVGIELSIPNESHKQLNQTGHLGGEVCMAMRSRGLIVRPLGDVVVLMPIPATPQEVLHEMMDVVVDTISQRFAGYG